MGHARKRLVEARLRRRVRVYSSRPADMTLGPVLRPSPGSSSRRTGLPGRRVSPPSAKPTA
jgi:hypothetical protein